MDARKPLSAPPGNATGRRCSLEQRVRQAVISLQAEGKVPSFYQVAKRANVARSTLYRNPMLREIVCRSRDEASALVAARDRPAATGDPPEWDGAWRGATDVRADVAALRCALAELQAEYEVLAQGLAEGYRENDCSHFTYGVCLLEDAA
ncbi:hypothetical protein VIN30_00935 [Adlercreutzia sp. R7]|uniref:TetR family transcriptional regulator n=1 Tax=Adlercreutzia wanghongyangiae TaxID=3111451 RepID=A0ABU6IF09_9ACTN|nr:hypothetical protein [Adlercreutzia sp. R7]